jgi:hypothetical protein
MHSFYVEKARKPIWRKGTLQASGMNGKQGLGDAILIIKGFFLPMPCIGVR